MFKTLGRRQPRIALLLVPRSDLLVPIPEPEEEAARDLVVLILGPVPIVVPPNGWDAGVRGEGRPPANAVQEETTVSRAAQNRKRGGGAEQTPTQGVQRPLRFRAPRGQEVVMAQPQPGRRPAVPVDHNSQVWMKSEFQCRAA